MGSEKKNHRVEKSIFKAEVIRGLYPDCMKKIYRLVRKVPKQRWVENLNKFFAKDVKHMGKYKVL